MSWLTCVSAYKMVYCQREWVHTAFSKSRFIQYLDIHSEEGEEVVDVCIGFSELKIACDGSAWCTGHLDHHWRLWYARQRPWKSRTGTWMASISRPSQYLINRKVQHQWISLPASCHAWRRTKGRLQTRHNVEQYQTTQVQSQLHFCERIVLSACEMFTLLLHFKSWLPSSWIFAVSYFWYFVNKISTSQ